MTNALVDNPEGETAEPSSPVPPASARPVRPWDAGLEVELVVALGLVLVSLRYLKIALQAAATNSLWTDELYSIIHYSGKGPWTTLTTYDVANNHIFFNLLNSLTPGAGSVDPLHARIWSIVAVLGMLALPAYELFRRRWFLAGGVFVFVVCINQGWLQLALQARGYGLLGFCAAASAIWVWRYLEAPATRWLVAFALVTLAGTWSVPTFVLFAGPLWLAVLAVDRSRRVFVAGATTLAAIVVVYLPVQHQLRTQFSTYASIYGREFAHLSAVWVTVRSYVEVRQWPILAVDYAVIAVGVTTALLHRRLGVRRSTALTAAVILGSGVVFIGICLVLQTPAPRTASFVVWPFLLGGLLPTAELLAVAVGEIARIVVALVVALLMIPGGWGYRKHHIFLPVEDWKGAAAYVAHTFPNGTLVYNDREPQNLQAYLSAGDRLAHYAPALAIANGREVVVDIRLKSTMTPVEQRLATLGDLVEQDLPELRGLEPPHKLRIVFGIPRTSNIEHATIDGNDAPKLTDRNLATVASSTAARGSSAPRAVLDLAPDTTVRSLVLVPTAKIPATRVHIVLVTADGKRITVAPRDLVASSDLLTVPLGDQQLRSIEISSPAPFGLREAWVYPS